MKRGQRSGVSPREQSSPGNLQSGQQPSKGKRHIPHSVSSLGVIHFHTATAVQFLNLTVSFGGGEEEGERVWVGVEGVVATAEAVVVGVSDIFGGSILTRHIRISTSPRGRS